jgi:imidazolonepropionase-like amidohydrolase
LAAPHATGETLLLRNATVHTVSGAVLSPGDVLIENGKIRQTGRIDSQADRTIDLAGQHLYPGLIALNTAMGLVEISGVRATRDLEEVGEFDPDVESWIAVNPDSELLPVARANGIALFEPAPQGGMVAGQSGLVAIDGWTTEQMVFKKSTALHVYWPGMDINPTPRRGRRANAGAKSVDDQARERRLKIKQLEDFFDDARAYSRAREAARTNAASDPGLNPSWEAMRPFVEGRAPIVVHADDLRQIKAAVNWAVTNNYKIIIAGGRDAWKAAEILVKNNIPVIYGGIYALPPDDAASYETQFAAPDRLFRAGVKVAFSIGEGGEDTGLVKNLPYCAAQAAAFGLTTEEALKSITLYPAQMLGVEDRLGSIEQGKDATLFASDGDILDIRASVKHLWIAGKEVSLENRHTRLYEKYRNRPKP